jgi:hypothetical protein
MITHGRNQFCGRKDALRQRLQTSLQSFQSAANFIVVVLDLVVVVNRGRVRVRVRHVFFSSGFFLTLTIWQKDSFIVDFFRIFYNFFGKLFLTPLLESKKKDIYTFSFLKKKHTVFVVTYNTHN